MFLTKQKTTYGFMSSSVEGKVLLVVLFPVGAGPVALGVKVN